MTNESFQFMAQEVANLVFSNAIRSQGRQGIKGTATPGSKPAPAEEAYFPAGAGLTELTRDMLHYLGTRRSFLGVVQDAEHWLLEIEIERKALQRRLNRKSGQRHRLWREMADLEYKRLARDAEALHKTIAEYWRVCSRILETSGTGGLGPGPRSLMLQCQLKIRGDKRRVEDCLGRLKHIGNEAKIEGRAPIPQSPAAKMASKRARQWKQIEWHWGKGQQVSVEVPDDWTGLYRLWVHLRIFGWIEKVGSHWEALEFSHRTPPGAGQLTFLNYNSDLRSIGVLDQGKIRAKPGLVLSSSDGCIWVQCFASDESPTETEIAHALAQALKLKHCRGVVFVSPNFKRGGFKEWEEPLGHQTPSCCHVTLTPAEDREGENSDNRGKCLEWLRRPRI